MGREQGSREEPANRPLPPPGSGGLPTSRENQAIGRGERPGGGNLLALPPHPTPPFQSTKSPRVPWGPTILRGVTLGLHWASASPPHDAGSGTVMPGVPPSAPPP